ncbi:hypothetical protein BASA83_013129 [Batrachochytrium salamandrivorans]|nr:hypothetical protein BASA83_013129 [Batrachochytrium salamandrivorans]
MQKNENSKSNHGKGKPAPSGAFTHRIREDGEVFSSEEGRETSSDTTPLASVAGSVVCGRLIAIARHLKTPDSPTLSKRPTHQQLVERQSEFRKAGAAAWLALKRKTSVPAHSAPKVELSSDLRLIYASGFPYAKPGDLRKAMQGACIRTSAVRDIRWISRQVVQLLVDADYVSAFTRIITSLDATIVKSFKAWILAPKQRQGKLAAIVVCCKDRHNHPAQPDTPGFSISTLEIVPKESLPVKKATDKEPAAPAVDPPSDTAAEITPAIQVDGVAPTAPYR